MKIKILDKFSYQSLPIEDGMVEFNEDDLKEIGRTKQFDLSNNTIIDYKSPQKFIEEKYQIEAWFSDFYTKHEQKYRRLYTLNLNDDDGISGYNKLIQLYNEAEIKRKRIQELEILINDNSK